MPIKHIPPPVKPTKGFTLIITRPKRGWWDRSWRRVVHFPDRFNATFYVARGKGESGELIVAGDTGPEQALRVRVLDASKMERHRVEGANK